MRSIKKLEPENPIQQPKKRVAAYARVSMETERLQHSLSAQISYYNDKIQKNPDWLFAGVYADDGISGTGTAKRDEFKRLIADCEAGLIDIVLTKSISRFARNTVDLLETVRHLREIGVEVWFERENIHSMSGDGELMLSILASFAQEESRSISDNVKWGTRKRFEQGIPNGHFRVYGYRWEGDELIPVPEEAAIVRRIFQNVLVGKSRLETEREFEAEGIRTRAGCRWEDSNIHHVLTNCTYTGDMLLQKEYISDPITKKRKRNHGELPQYLVSGHHEAIIDRATFDYVQQEMARRSELGPLANKSLNLSCFTGKLKCPHCGMSLMHSRDGHHNRGTEDFWKCGATKKKGGRCPVKGCIRDDKLRAACARALGLEQFNEAIFLDRVDRIDVPERYTIDIHMKDGTVLREDCTPTGHKDCWTEEARAKASAYRRSHRAEGKKGSCCLTCKIRCATCGANYHAAKQGDMRYWRCSGKRDGISLREDALQSLIADVLGLDSYNEADVEAALESIVVDGDQLTFSLTDGRTETRTWVKPKRPAHVPTEEERERRRQAMLARMTPEYRQRMSEHMKQLRKERGANWRR